METKYEEVKTKPTTLEVELTPEQALEFDALGPAGRQAHYCAGLVHGIDQRKVQVEHLKTVKKYDFTKDFREKTFERKLSKGRMLKETAAVITFVLKMQVTPEGAAAYEAAKKAASKPKAPVLTADQKRIQELEAQLAAIKSEKKAAKAKPESGSAETEVTE